VLVLLASGIGTVSAFSNSGDGDWKYYKELTVKENLGKTLTNFQVLIELNSANFDFSKAKSDDKAAKLAKKDIAKGLNKAKKYSPISVASATSPKDYYFSHDNQNDPCDMTKEIFVGDPLDGWEDLNLKMSPQPLTERIRTPDEISREILEKGSTTIKLSPTEFSILLGPTSGESPIEEDLLCVKINGKPELLSVYDYPYADWGGRFEPDIKDHFIIRVPGHYVVCPHDKPKNHDELSSPQNMVYIEDPESIELLGKTIPWKEAYDKSLAEIFDEFGLDKDDRGIFGRTPSQTSSPAESTPSEVPKGEEKGIPGFEVIFAIAGLLAVAYILRRRDK
jgi:PGF-CTERM protein